MAVHLLPIALILLKAFLIGTAVGGTVVLVAEGWSYLKEFFKETVVPAINQFDSALANAVSELVHWLDDSVLVPIRQFTREQLCRLVTRLKSLYGKVKNYLLGIEFVYELIDLSKVNVKAITRIKTEDGRTVEILLNKEIVDLKKLPPELQQKLRNGSVKQEVSLIFDQEVEKRLNELEKIEMELKT